MNFKEVQQIIDSDLKKVSDTIRSFLDSKISFIGQVASYLIESGGKRFRPTVHILSARACGYEGERMYTIASTLEFIHTATLLHDDVVDYAELRRGQPTANILWGNEATVLVGDFLLARSFYALVGDGDLDVLKCVSNATTRMAEGEILQLLQTNNPEITFNEYLEIIKCKTAVLIAAASECGAILGKKDSQIRQRMHNFGMKIGIAFQITDDTLDYIIEDKTLGKTRGQDFLDGKVTLPFILAYEKSEEREREVLKSLFLKEEKDQRDFDKIYNILESKNAFNESFQHASRYVEEAKEEISFLESSYRDYLEIIADYILERKY
ncbi:MAG: polyprenyl synthetase family protein [Proteobacteria bacterium]|nr:polyprenyl synthetase family protein [Pseudomonadota bacterium]